MSSFPLARNAILALVLVCCTLGTGAGESESYVFVPEPDFDGAAVLSGSTWIGHGPGFTLRLQRVDEAQRLAFIEKVTGVATDPFATRPGNEPRFLSFLAQLENNGGGSLVFRAQQCWLITNKKEHLSPMAMDTLRATYGVMGQEMSPAYGRVDSAFLPTTRTLEAGESMAGLLVYNMFKPGTRRYHLEVQLTTAAGDVVPVTAAYRRVKQERAEP